MERIARGEEEKAVDWLSSGAAGEEFSAEWVGDNYLPGGWQSKDHPVPQASPSSDIENLKTILKGKAYIRRKKIILKKQIKDLTSTTLEQEFRRFIDQF